MTRPARTGPVVPLASALRDARDALALQPLPPGLAAQVQQQWARCDPTPVSDPATALLLLPGAAGRAPAVSAHGGRPMPGAGRAVGMLQPLWQRWLAGSGAALCLVALAMSVILMLSAPPQPVVPLALAPTSGFLPVVSAQRLAELAADAGPAWLVPGEWPRERLSAFGLPYDPARAGETVRAELLVHASGDVLAVRLLAQ